MDIQEISRGQPNGLMLKKNRLCFTSKYWSKNAHVYNLSYHLVLNPNFSHRKYAKFNPMTGISFVSILSGGIFLVIFFFFVQS